MNKKNITLITLSVLFLFLLAFLLCSCNSRASLESDIKEYNEKISSLNNDLEAYQNIYDEALSVYQQYSKYSGSPDWDNELSRTKNIMNEAQSKISSIKRDIALYEAFKKSKENQLDTYK